MYKQHATVMGEGNLVRDMNSKAVLETDLDKYKEYKKRKALQDRLLNLEKKFEALLQHVSD